MAVKSIEDTTRGQPRLTFWDTVSIVVGIVIGASIFRVPSSVFVNVTAPWMGIALWIIGGGLSLVGALCYSELAATYPRSGGGYVYLTRAYGRWMGFLFGWAQLIAILTGSIVALAYVFGDYTAGLLRLDSRWSVYFALAAILAVTLINICGIILGKAAQNILTAAKIMGLAAVMAAGIFAVTPTAPETTVAAPASPVFGIAMIFVLYAYGGWNDVSFVTAEVRDPQRTMPRALLLGTLAITAIYVLVNLSYLHTLGFSGIRGTSTPAADVLQKAWGMAGARIVSLLVMVSTLGAVNGMVLSGARIYAELGSDHGVLGWLAVRSRKTDAPIGSFCGQALAAVLLILAVGTESGRDLLDLAVIQLGLNPLPWSDFRGGFELLVAVTAPAFWLFFLLTGLALVILRFKDSTTLRPFTVPFYPLTPAVFCLTSLYMLYASLKYAGLFSLLAVVPIAMGALLYWLGLIFRERNHQG